MLLLYGLLQLGAHYAASCSKLTDVWLLLHVHHFRVAAIRVCNLSVHHMHFNAVSKARSINTSADFVTLGFP